jgi:N-acetylmuramoyl-L-alanine amidase
MLVPGLGLWAVLLLAAVPCATAAQARTAAPSHAVARSHAPAAQLKQMRLTGGKTSVQLTLSLTAPVPAHVFRLHKPERVVIDLPHTRAHAPIPAPPPDSMVTALRTGVHGRGGLRVVLQLRGGAGLKLERHSAAGGSELRLELGSPAPLQAAAPTARAPTVTRVPAAAPVAVRAAHAPSGQREVIVAVDAGHGGVDPGATGPDGTHEKDITLAIARALAARINRTAGMRAVLTRDGDYFVALRDRMVRAHAAHADLFVSIHADSVRDRSVSGASVYILSERGASSEAARRLAEQENAADLKGGISLAAQAPDLRSVLLDLSQSASIGESGIAASDVLDALDGVGDVRKREVQHAAFVVLKSPDLPSMLVETAYISNPADERRLRSPAQQRRLAEAIFDGIADYFHQFPPQGSLFARTRTGGSADSS